MIKASDIMRRAATQLIDEDHIRWPLPELADWIGEAVSEIVKAKPSASSRSMNLSLVAGTKQKLPTDQRIMLLLDISRNVEGTGGAGGRMIKPVTRDSLDALEPRWHDPAQVPFKKEVRHFIYDATVPLEYSCYPGNDGTGMVEANVSYLPPSVAALIGTADPTDIATWNVSIGLSDEYQAPVLDYVMYRAFSKEEPASTPGRAAGHYQVFATSIGIQVQVEQSNSPNRRR
ncbi:MAG: hypothetical protein DI528_12840 [Shinella sp.]|nr:MAG: hypothetical protein DI528_12840 [Shinella sp.]